MILLDNNTECYTLTHVPRKKVNTQKNWRPTPEDSKLLAELSKKLGVSDSNVVRLALRCLAEKESVGTLQRAG